MIEAVITIPLLLLVTISMIYLGMFYFRVFDERLDVQKTLLMESQDNKTVFSIVSEGTTITGESQGLFTDGFRKEYSQRLYIINSEIIVRGGGLLGIKKE